MTHHKLLSDESLQKYLAACTPKMVGVTGLEPVTLRLSSACSNQLSYTPEKCASALAACASGGAEEIRTPDL